MAPAVERGASDRSVGRPSDFRDTFARRDAQQREARSAYDKLSKAEQFSESEGLLSSTGRGIMVRDSRAYVARKARPGTQPERPVLLPTPTTAANSVMRPILLPPTPTAASSTQPAKMRSSDSPSESVSLVSSQPAINTSLMSQPVTSNGPLSTQPMSNVLAPPCDGGLAATVDEESPPRPVVVAGRGRPTSQKLADYEKLGWKIPDNSGVAENSAKNGADVQEASSNSGTRPTSWNLGLGNRQGKNGDREWERESASNGSAATKGGWRSWGDDDQTFNDYQDFHRVSAVPYLGAKFKLIRFVNGWNYY